MTVANGQTAQVTATLTNADLNGDGLPDEFESGYRDGFGNWHAPDPYAIDTDGDGLSDGYEAGEMVIDANGKTYFKQRSDPTKVDTDGDGLDDYLEDAIGSDPFNPDSDGDGLSDALEWEIGTDLWLADTDGDGHTDYEEWYDPDYDPLVYEERFGPLEMGREFLLGAVLGEWGVDDHDNLFYLGGWIASGVIVIGDIRDIAATISRGDLIGTGLNLAALIPGYGDAAKIAAIVGKFVLKHPELIKPAVLLLAGVTKYSDETTEALSILRSSYGDEVINVLKAHGTTDATLVQLYKKDVNLFRVRHMLENVCEGGWAPAPSRKLTASGNLDKHYTEHVLEKFEWGETFTKSVYLQKATTLSNRRDHTVELYYQMGYDTLVVYDRGAGEFVSVTKDGLFTTFFKPKIDPHYVDETIADRLIRLN